MEKIVIGIGNPNFKDDGVGLKVVEKLNGLVDTVNLLNADIKIIKFLLNRKKVVLKLFSNNNRAIHKLDKFKMYY